MVKADLITGFLGSGKTTFLRRYVSYLADSGERVCILENDYGAVNVDMMLLSDLRSDRVGLEMVAGGCDYDCHRRRFKTKLITMAMLGYDRVVIEPSGVFDVDEFFDLLHEDPLDERYAISNVITIVEPVWKENTAAPTEAAAADAGTVPGFCGAAAASEEADYLLASQAACAGCVVISHAQEADGTRIDETMEHLNDALGKIGCRRNFRIGTNAVAGDWDLLTKEDWKRISESGYCETSFEKSFSMDESGFQNMFFMHVPLGPEEIKERIRAVFRDPAAGNVIRIKGFLPDAGGSSAGEQGGGSGSISAASGDGWLEINASAHDLRVSRIPEGQEILIVIGEGLNEDVLNGYFPSRYSTGRERAAGDQCSVIDR